MKRISMLPLAMLVLLACKSKKEQPKQAAGNQPVVVDVIIASTSSLSNTLEVNGTVVANEAVELRPEISGRLVQLNLPEGASVKQGTVLAKINDADIAATLEKTKVQLDLAEKTEARLKKLLAVSGINQSDYDVALNQVNSLKADMAVTQALLDKAVVRAPFSGVLGLRMVSPGAYVTSATVLATLQQTDQVKIDFTLPEMYASLIEKGRTVTVQTNENNTLRKARIIATEPQINATTRNLKVRAVLEGKAIHPGAFVKVRLETGGRSSSILVPTNAIIPDAKAKKVVVVRQGKGVFVDIETGLREAGAAEVVKGLAVGDSVVVTGVLFVRPKSPVKVRSVKKLSDFTQ
ncbi:efflux RND transporter periplasmic adaptor subunit [Sediminibacterium ginsengisoli]|nr:efflux RND transporter periplasmic adaptor subunit [Sediminibacterium ginsengisoli]